MELMDVSLLISGRCANDVDHHCRRGHVWCVIDLMCMNTSLHTARHETLGLGRDHVVLLGDEIPTR